MPLSPPLAMRYASRASIMRTLLVLVAAAGVVGQRHGTAKAFGPEQHVLSTERYAGGGSADYRAGSDASAEFTLQSNAELMGKTSARTDEGLFAASRAARKVAIIGGGAGGSSAAYFLSRAHEKLEAGGRGGEGFDITLLERDERIGGRAAVVHPYDDPQYPAVELGASIFADVNKNMQRAVKQFKLTTGAKLGEGAPGIWDGQQFLVENLADGWWNSARLFWRYGYSPVTTQKLVGKLVDKFVQLYDASFMHKPTSEKQVHGTESGFPWSTIGALAKALSLDSLASMAAGDHFYAQGVSKLFVEEIIEAATLVNYGQEVWSIHGVGGSVSLAASGSVGVDGGNYQIFENFVGSCDQLRMRLGVHGDVTGLARFRTAQEALQAGIINGTDMHLQRWGKQESQTEQLSSPNRTTKWWAGTRSGYGDLFDAVFVAAPWHASGITLLNTDKVIPTTPYVRLHVTLVVTSAPQPNPAYFGRGEKDVVPTSILTSHASLRKAEEEERKRRQDRERGKRPLRSADRSYESRAAKGDRFRAFWPWGGGGGDEKRGPRLDFNSLTYLMEIPSPTAPDEKEHVVKLFSPQELSDGQLNEMFGEGTIRWTFRKEWDAYPYLTPTAKFPPIEADSNLYYLNAMEPLVSTMETATVSARNAVALYLEREFGPDFVHGGKDCPWDKAADGEGATAADDDSASDGDGDWAAWGCRSA